MIEYRIVCIIQYIIYIYIYIYMYIRCSIGIICNICVIVVDVICMYLCDYFQT